MSEIVSTQLAKPQAGRQYAAAAGGKEAKERWSPLRVLQQSKPALKLAAYGAPALRSFLLPSPRLADRAARGTTQAP